MTYANYLKFYSLTESKATREDWLYNEWSHGRVYKYGNKFFSVTTGHEVR